MTQRAVLRFLLLILFFALTASRTGQAGQKINVVVSLKPIHSLVAGVMEGVGSPYLLIKNGSPHTYSMRPSQARTLQKADLVFWVGKGLETFLATPLQSLANNAQLVTLQKTKGLSLHTIHKLHNHAKTHDHADQTGTIDPHIWLDPQNARMIVAEVAKVLSYKDPMNARLYAANSQKMITRLDRLSARLQTMLSPLRAHPYLSFHDDLQYFERRFGLSYAGSIINVADRRPGARHLKKLRAILKQRDIKCVFSEPRFKPALVELIIEGSTAKVTTLDLLGQKIAPGPELYFTLLKTMATSFRACLSRT